MMPYAGRFDPHTETRRDRTEPPKERVTVFSQQEPILFAARATSLIIAACRSVRRPVVLLPALYCAEVAAAIEEAGLRYRCYDVPADLSSASSMIDLAYDSSIGSVVILHPFGLSRPLHDIALPGETLLVEDACHALRTALHDSAAGGGGDITVYSPRKELGWPEGGVATGPLVRSVKDGVAPAPQVARQWRRANIPALAREGRQATQLAAEVLADKLPLVSEGEVLTALPLKSTRRDATINRLRAHGIMAWRWMRPLKDTGPKRTPQTWALRRKLLLVPLPSGAELERTLDLLGKEPLEDWE